MTAHLLPPGIQFELQALRQRVAELEQENHHLRALIAPLPSHLVWRLHLFETIASYAHGAIMVTEVAPLEAPGPQVIYANPSFERMTGHSTAQVLGRHLEPLLGPQLTRDILIHLRRTYEDATPVRTELLTTRRDGAFIALDLELVPVQAAGGHVTHVIVFQRDITVRRRTEIERDTLLMRLAATNQELIAELQARRHAEKSLQQLNQRLEHLVDTRTAQLRGVVDELEAEIQERRRVSDELRRSQALLQSFLDHVPAALGVQDLEGRFILVNEKLVHTIGLSSPAELLGHTPARFFPPAIVREAEQDILHIQHTGTTVTREYGHLETNGRIMLAHSFPIRHSDGTVIAVGHIAMDITERKHDEEARLNLERQLLEAQRRESIGLLAGGIAHDFNNLLTVIQGHAELALLDLAPDSPLHESIEAIVHGVQRAADLTAQMLAYAGKGRFIVQPLQLNSLIHEMAELLRASITRHATVHYRLNADLPPIEADAAQIRQVVLNLLVNASEALNDRTGQIVLETGVAELSAARLKTLILGPELRPGVYVRMSVTDTGCGMDETTRARMFEPFFSTKFTGRGLGLAALQGIIRSHHGALEVLSAPDLGTTIHVYLPASAVPLAEPAPDADEATLARQGTVLIVDDEESVRCIARGMLERLGFHTLEVASGEAGLDLFSAGIPDLTAVMLDLTLPGLGGDAVARRMLAAHPELRIILMSGYCVQEIGQRHADLPIAAVLQKPFSFAVLQSALGA